jgi:hypothetical protein
VCARGGDGESAAARAPFLFLLCAFSTRKRRPETPTITRTTTKQHHQQNKQKQARTSLGGTTPYQITMTPEVGSAGKKADGLEYNLFCANAVLHAVDQVLLPKL